MVCPSPVREGAFFMADQCIGRHWRSSQRAMNTAPLSHCMRYTSTGPFTVSRPAPTLPLHPCRFARRSTLADETPERNPTFSTSTRPVPSSTTTRSMDGATAFTFFAGSMPDAAECAACGAPFPPAGNNEQPAINADIANARNRTCRFITDYSFTPYLPASHQSVCAGIPAGPGPKPTSLYRAASIAQNEAACVTGNDPALRHFPWAKKNAAGSAAFF